MNLPGVIVDLPTLTAKDETDLVQWGIPNDIDFIAASFVRKGSDLDYIRKVPLRRYHNHPCTKICGELHVASAKALCCCCNQSRAPLWHICRLATGALTACGRLVLCHQAWLLSSW